MVGSTVTMPPRSSLTSSFSVSDANNEVVCPLRNQDGSSCRKRCLGEKRYRSMQEHIRRAHPEHYIPKLPATEASFQDMINKPPDEQPAPPSTSQLAPHGMSSAHNSPRHANNNYKIYGGDRHSYYGEESSTPNTPRMLDEYHSAASMLPAASAAAALAQLHKAEPEWETEGEWMSDSEAHKQAMRSSIELPPIHSNHIGPTSDPFSDLNNVYRRRELLPSMFSGSPPGRSSTLPPIQRHPGPNRPRKQSVSKRAREPQHKRQKSKGENNNAAHLRRMSYDRKAFSAEPSSALLSAANRSRWEDLLDAATSATSDVDEDRTPIPPSPISVNRASLPPFPNSQPHFQGYQASPLQQALTPPSNLPDAPEPFPSVESGDSGNAFRMNHSGLSDSSPSFSSQDYQIYCAACRKLALLKDSYACTECICGICSECVDVLLGEQGARRKCPHCATVGGKFKPFQLEFR